MVTSMGKEFLMEEFAERQLVDFQTDASFQDFLRAKRVIARHPVGGRKRVKQAPRDQVDINLIVKRHKAQGIPLPPPGAEPVYGDFTGVTDYHDSLNRVIAIKDDFMKLPSEVRKACNNDPGLFIEMCCDADRLEELRELGLVDSRIPSVAERTLEVLQERLAAPVTDVKSEA